VQNWREELRKYGYYVQSKLGRGGFGIVVLANHRSTERNVSALRRYKNIHKNFFIKSFALLSMCEVEYILNSMFYHDSFIFMTAMYLKVL